MKRILVFGAHPDDIELGVGGTLARYMKEGVAIKMVVVTMPSALREKECQEAAKILGAELEMLHIAQDDLIYVRNLVKLFDTIITGFNPTEIYTHWTCDSHQEHRYVSQAVIAATRKNDCSVYMYEQTLPSGLTEGEFNAQLFIDISDYLDHKIESVLKNESQYMPNRGESWVEAITGRCAYRGYQIGVKYAEAFEIIKEIRK
jgi:N-acetylglucosamine malate deacetylase 1